MRCAPAVLAVLAAALAGCGSVAPDARLSYANVQTLNPGVDGRWVLEEFPQAAAVERDGAGRLRRLSYGVTDPTGKPRDLTLWFDANEVLERKEYSGTLVRPKAPEPMSGRAPLDRTAPPPR